ncbi:hypothetical protein BDU57DRAFT_518713 [Ampelomyces quisqualis]|uniref:Uncharacterized protein n=1 Tax=Ampelomyces quisqualis TaxID=50730 RepID=A0A6A5QJQ1_AMPQU|nr:hypothetical protein BDU57DRAFT_518713 [Ampelomyces quisqualis]
MVYSPCRMFKFYLLLAIALPLTQAVRLFLTNEEGWKHPYLRSFFNLLDDGNTDRELLLCAPKNKLPEYHGSVIIKPVEVHVPDNENDDIIKTPPKDEVHPVFQGGILRSDPRISYAEDSYSEVQQGLKYRAPLVYKWRPDSDPPITSPDTQEPWKADLILYGPNNGNILGSNGHFHGLFTVRILTWHGHQIISFAGAPTTHTNPYRHSEAIKARTEIYAKLAKHITQRVIESGTPPYLPKKTYLSVNFPDPFSDNKRCTEVADFTFVLTSHWKKDISLLPNLHCNRLYFPYEKKVVQSKGCYVAITLGDSRHPSQGFTGRPSPRPWARQQIINMLGPILGCFKKEDEKDEPK